MTDATFSGPWRADRPAKADTVDLPRPAPVPVSAPVLIGDAVTPLAGGTLLSLLMQRMAETDLDE